MSSAFGPVILTPRCPVCSGPPDPRLSALFWPAQAWCADLDCEVLLWHPQSTLEHNLTRVTVVDLTSGGAPASG